MSLEQLKSQHLHRIEDPLLHSKIMTPAEAAQLFKNNMVVATSGFTKSGDSKVVLNALAERTQTDPLKISLYTGASLGHGTDGKLAHTMNRRLPFQADPELRKHINAGQVYFIDQHLSETANLLSSQFLPAIDIAVIEVTKILNNGLAIPTTSLGNNLAFIKNAKHIILEVNTTVPETILGFHDVFDSGDALCKPIIPITEPHSLAGAPTLPFDINKVVGIVFSDIKDSYAELLPPDSTTTTIAAHLLDLLAYEVKQGRLPKNLRPLQAGIGKVANAVLSGFQQSDFNNLTMYSEVLQDSTFELIDSGKMSFASASALALSEKYYENFMLNMDKYRGKVILRPQSVSNAVEVIRRLGLIAINTAIEFDIYGNVNSTHIAGTHIMNGIGGSGDFARNSYLSIFVAPSASKKNTISHVVPMVSHVDSSEHDIDIVITEQGLADLRGLAPRERAQVILNNCCHPEYKDQLKQYMDEANQKGGHTPHVLDKALSWHSQFKAQGSMKLK